MWKSQIASRYPILDKQILNLSNLWKIRVATLIFLLTFVDLLSTFSIAIMIGNLAQNGSKIYFDFNLKIALLGILFFTLLKPRIVFLISRSLSRRQSELEILILDKFLKSELVAIKERSTSHQYSRILNRIEGELATIFNDFFPAIIVLIIESLFLLFTLVFFIKNFPLLTIFGTLLSVSLIRFLLKNSIKRLDSLQHDRSKVYALSLSYLHDLISGLKESLVIGNSKSFYSRYMDSKSRLIHIKFSKEIENAYQRQLIEGAGVVSLALFSIAIQFGFIGNDITKSMLVIAFAIRLTPCFSRIASAISRANSTVPVMNDLVNEVGINFRNIFLEESFFTEEFEVSNSIKILDINIVVNEKQLIRDLNLNVVPGDIVGIEGPSGTGKTMLLETIAGLRYPTSGRIVMPSKYSKNMAYLKQDAHIMNENVEENIRFLRESLHNTVITNLIIKLQIPNLGNLSNNLNPDVFSGGERQRLALARTFANQPNLVFLDEPTSAQDGKRRDLILELISGGENRIIFICTHSKEILARCTKSIKLG